MNDDRALSIDPAAAGEAWSVDAGAPLQSVLDRPDTPPPLRQVLTGVLSWQVRVETPVARSLRAPGIAPQWVAALLALGATVVVEGEDRSAEVGLEALLQREVEGEVVTLHVPLNPTRRWGEARVARTPTDEPVVAAFAAVDLDDGVVRQARVALTGVWPEAVRLAGAPSRLEGALLDAPGIRETAAAVEQEVAPKGNYLGSEKYRRAMAGVLTRRALEACLGQEA